MSKITLLYLTEVSTVLNEAGLEKFNNSLEANSSVGALKRDDYGRTAQSYEDMNLPVPKELQGDTEELSDDFVRVNPEDIEYDFNDCVINLSDFMVAIDHEDIGSTVFTRNDFQIHVEETSEEINFLIQYLQQTPFERLLYNIKNWINTKLNK